MTYEGLDSAGLESQVEKVRAAVERDDLRSPNVKKLASGPYYRAKLDDAARLLLQFVSWRGEKACLALEVIRQHDYARSRFLRGARVDESKLGEEVTPEALAPAPIRYLHPTRNRFHLLDKPISFDDAQDEVLRRRPPLVIVGSAGSGKTALMLQKLRAQPGRVAYVTESAWLTQAARALYVAHDFDPGEQEADFLSYTQLLESIQVPGGKALTFRDFRVFFERHRQKVRFATAHQCFEELRGVLTADPSGVLSRDAYLALGVRQSIFTVEQRAEVHALLGPWMEWMAASGLYEPNLCAQEWLARVTPRYDFVAVDEVQDLTPVQLSLVLGSLKAPGGFVLGGDAHQIVHPNFFSWSKVKSLFWRGGSAEEIRDIAILDASYRNSQAVTTAGNALLTLKHVRFGALDRESTSLMRSVGGAPGQVRGLRTGTAAVQSLAEATRGSAKVAVVVLREEDKAEARQAFRTPLVFSIHEAKGLEYQSVVLYRLVSSERRTFQALCEGISAQDLQLESLEYARARDKADRSLEAFKFYVNALYVGLTRAVENAWLVEDDPSHPLLGHLGISFEEGQVRAPALGKSTVEEWQHEARRLEQQGKLEQAEAIRTTILRSEPVPWTPLEMPALEALAAKALDPKGVSAKARQQLCDYAFFHCDMVLADRLEMVGFQPARSLRAQRVQAARRLLQIYEAKNHREVLALTERHGVEYRSPMNLTPLMMAAYAGNLALVEALLGRGARQDARDHLGQTALHWALRRAWDAPGFAEEGLGELYDVLAPPSFDAMVDGRMVQVGRELGEYYLFHVLLASWGRRYSLFGRVGGFSAKEVVASPFDWLPEVVVRTNRKTRTYVNHVLARSEANSAYPTSRRLWWRERQGHYVPNPALSLRVSQPDGTEAWKPVLEVLSVAWMERYLASSAIGRIGGGSSIRAA
ncbi:MAG TPA: ankyrin repeat domain-containing protein [Myxococcaceae bacterium]|nr:ankyrin repeat domain-containing protein [Myxococcaceae bacterium]